MKGSPILATALACIIMLSMYVGMRLVFSQDKGNPESVFQPIKQAEIASVSTYTDLHFSTQPESITISHPATNKQLLNLTSLNDYEWSGEIQLPNSFNEELELLCEVKWAEQKKGYQFIQLTLSPDGLADQSQTLRAEGDITDIMTFHWKEATDE